MTRKKYDAIVVGAGHNGLTGAASGLPPGESYRRTLLAARSLPFLRAFRLGHAKPIPRVVFHNRLDAIELLFGRRCELDSFRLQLLVRLAAIARLQHSSIQLSRL